MDDSISAKSTGEARRSLVGIGSFAVIVTAIQVVHHVVVAETADLLWACNLASVGLIAGIAIRNRRVTSIACLWLCTGTPLWLLDIFAGGLLELTSTILHFGGLFAGVLATRALGYRRGSWWRAVALFAVLQFVTHWITPPDLNINLSHGVWSGWEDMFPSYSSYLLLLYAGSLLGLFLLERLFARAFAEERT